jgi:hypothetical protein
LKIARYVNNDFLEKNKVVVELKNILSWPSLKHIKKVIISTPKKTTNRIFEKVISQVKKNNTSGDLHDCLDI